MRSVNGIIHHHDEELQIYDSLIQSWVNYCCSNLNSTALFYNLWLVSSQILGKEFLAEKNK